MECVNLSGVSGCVSRWAELLLLSEGGAARRFESPHRFRCLPVPECNGACWCNPLVSTSTEREVVRQPVGDLGAEAVITRGCNAPVGVESAVTLRAAAPPAFMPLRSSAA